MKQNRSEIEERQKLALIIANMYEFNTRYNSPLAIESLIQQRENKKNFAISAEMALFWGGSTATRIAILPAKPDPLFIEDIADKLNVHIKCLSPKLVTGWICRDLLMDQEACDELVDLLRPYEVFIFPWGVTQYYYQLLFFLQDKGIRISDTNCPSIHDSWSVDYCDSKIGSRSIIEQMRSHFPGFGAPSGYVAHNYTEATAISHALWQESTQSIIIKSDIGSGGTGIRLYNPKDKSNSSYTSISELLLSMSNNEIWQNGPVIVETAIGGGIDLSTPSFDGFIRADGSCYTMGIENMLTIERQCVGIEMGQKIIRPDLHSALNQIGIKIGEYISKLGYRGWYDVDFLLPNIGIEIYASEINTRRGGATSPIEFAQRLGGAFWADNFYIKTFEKLWLKKRLNGYKALKNILYTINRKFDGKRSGIIPLYSNSIKMEKPYIGYLIYAQSQEEGGAIESELHRLLPILMSH